MKDSDIARKAAKKVANDENIFSCTAIGSIFSPQGGLRQEYGEMFCPIEGQKYGEWVEWLEGNLDGIEMKNWRILALLFFAEILESEGR